MGAPKRIRANIDGVVISAFVVREATNKDELKIVCKTCAPNWSKMKLIGEVTQHGIDLDLHYAVYLCTRCATQWAVPFHTNTKDDVV